MQLEAIGRYKKDSRKSKVQEATRVYHVCN